MVAAVSGTGSPYNLPPYRNPSFPSSYGPTVKYVDPVGGSSKLAGDRRASEIEVRATGYRIHRVRVPWSNKQRGG